MLVKAMTFTLEPGISLYLVPETEVERTMLRSMWEHGEMQKCNGCADNTGEGFAIVWKQKKGDEKNVRPT
jgi:hypothetical protein